MALPISRASSLGFEALVLIASSTSEIFRAFLSMDLSEGKMVRSLHVLIKARLYKEEMDGRKCDTAATIRPARRAASAPPIIVINQVFENKCSIHNLPGL